MTFHLPVEVMERAKNAVYWTPGLTLAGLTAQALTDAVDRLEKKRGEAFPPRKVGTEGREADEMSAVCQRCKRDMMSAESCTDAALHIGGTDYFRVRFGNEKGLLRDGGRCGDCNVTRGSLHHLYCDIEECPKCGGQLISCGCVPDFLPK